MIFAVRLYDNANSHLCSAVKGWIDASFVLAVNIILSKRLCIQNLFPRQDVFDFKSLSSPNPKYASKVRPSTHL